MPWATAAIVTVRTAAPTTRTRSGYKFCAIASRSSKQTGRGLVSDLMDPIEVDRFWLEDAPIEPPEPLVWRRAAYRDQYLFNLAVVKGEKVNEHLYRVYLSEHLAGRDTGPDDHLIQN